MHRLAITLISLVLALGLAGTAAAQVGRTHAVLVGVSQYQDGVLPRTDYDASRMAAALQSDVPADRLDLHLLLNSDATRDRVIAALNEVARQSTRSDTFVFFYSGHGSQVAGQGASAEEPDGMEETIVLYDGHFHDDELSAALDRIQGRLMLIALDSCFSGGFGPDVLDRPGRIGMFSSDEDLTSAVPDEAGGYLSMYLAEALEGRADGVAEGATGQGRDGMLTALEIEVYVRDRFAENRRIPSDSISGSNVGYQYVVIRRAAVEPMAMVVGVNGTPVNPVYPVNPNNPQLPFDPSQGTVVASYDNVALVPDTGFNSRRPLGDFQLEAGRTYVIETFNLSGGADTVVELRRSSDPRQAFEQDPIMAENDDVTPGNLASRIVFTANESGAFYASVRPYAADTTGTFSLRVIEIAAAN